jgi:hypothetical protein
MVKNLYRTLIILLNCVGIVVISANAIFASGLSEVDSSNSKFFQYQRVISAPALCVDADEKDTVDDPEQEAVSAYLATLPRIISAIDLRQFTMISSGGTHNIYKLGRSPEFLLKVMQKTIGNTLEMLTKNMIALEGDYEQLYEIFGPQRCLVERRFIEQVKKPEQSRQENAIVSVVRFEPAFQNKEKFGLNFGVLEVDEIKINDNLSQYHAMNLGLMGTEMSFEDFNLDNFLVFEPFYREIFKILDEEESLRSAMKDFLTRFKTHYKKTDRFMDLRGKDNVIFFKTEAGWAYKVGSVIKHETGREVRKMLHEISINPTAINDSFENWTLIFHVPSWARGLNAIAKKLGMDKIIDNIAFSKEDSANLARIHMSLSFFDRSIYYAENGQFELALRFFEEFKKTEDSHRTSIRDLLGTSYWRYVQTKDADQLEKGEIEIFLRLLIEPRNVFPSNRYDIVRSSIEGLLSQLSKLGSIDPDIRDSSEAMLKRISV